MANNLLLSRYIWLVDTIRRCGRITSRELNSRWMASPVSDGKPLARRTFYNYREAIAQLFCLEIHYDNASREYYVDADSPGHTSNMTEWLLNSASISDLLSDSRQVASRISLEEIPSARQHLDTVVDALKHNQTIRFSYHPFTRSCPTDGVTIEPYMLKIFRQRWYVTGLDTASRRIKTYALDRMTRAEIMPEHFLMPAHFDPDEYFRHSFGIVVDSSEPRRVIIRADLRQAKYLRALPLHHSQQEMVHDGFSLFHYHLRITDDFINELLSLGPRVTVLAPPELRARITDSLRHTLALYDSPSTDATNNNS